MLAKYYRLFCENQSGESLSFDLGGIIAVRLTPWKLSGGDLVYGNVITEDFGHDGIDELTDGSVAVGSVIDNTSDKFWGVKGYANVQCDLDAAVGEFNFYLEESDVINDHWPSDADTFGVAIYTKLICILPVDPADDDEDASINFEF